VRRRGISPVIATVILVAVAIAVAIAVAFWMTGIVGLFTGFEQLQIVSAYAETVNDGWNVTVVVKNTGTAPATIDNIFINGKPASSYDGDVSINGKPASSYETIPVSPGNSTTIIIKLSKDSFTSGQSVEIKIHTAGGKEYPKLVVLP